METDIIGHVRADDYGKYAVRSVEPSLPSENVAFFPGRKNPYFSGKKGFTEQKFQHIMNTLGKTMEEQEE